MAEFVNEFKTDEWEVETPTGWQSFSGIGETIPYIVWKLKTINHTLDCADKHIVYKLNHKLDIPEGVFVQDLKIGDDIFVDGENTEQIISVEETKDAESMYDLMDVDGGNIYYTNGILSHNTTTVTSYLLHYILFNQSMNIAILANKQSTAKDILARLKLAYEYLPKWLQQGIKEWNKYSIALENGSRVLAAATSSSAIRGGSYNCIGEESKLTIRDSITREIWNITIGELYANSSRNTNNHTYEYGNHRQQIREISTGMGYQKGKLEVLTTEGYKSFLGVSKNFQRPTVKLTFINGTEIVCTPDHKISTSEGFICASDLTPKHIIKCIDGTTMVAKIDDHIVSDVYDLLEVEELHAFYANGIFVKNCILLDEYAHVPTNVAEEFFSSVYPTITSGLTTRVIMVSTPKGLNMFYHFWKGAQSKQNEYVPIEVTWNQVPKYPGGPSRDEDWKQETIRNSSERQFKEEFECVDENTMITVREKKTKKEHTITIKDAFDFLY